MTNSKKRSRPYQHSLNMGTNKSSSNQSAISPPGGIRRTRRRSRIREWSMGIIAGLSLSTVMMGIPSTFAQTQGTGESQGSATYPSLGKVEGCYNEFNSLMQVSE